MNPSFGKFLSNSYIVLLWVAGSERLHNKDSLLKTRKESKDQKEMFGYVLYRMAALKLERLKENTHVGVPF